MRGLLLYNPVAGPRSQRRTLLLEAVAETLRRNGYDLTVTSTTHRGSASTQAREAIKRGAEVIFACGGDGTVHEVLQGIVSTGATLAVIPMGTANVLCRELGVPLDAVSAAQSYGQNCIETVPVGLCQVSGATRYFLLLAGAGPDGALMYRMLTPGRSRWGRWSYAWHALVLPLQRSFASFTVVSHGLDGEVRRHRAVAAMAIRVSTLGGIFPGVARGASLRAPSTDLLLVKGPAWIGLPLWFLMSCLRLDQWNPLLERRAVTAFECTGDTGIHMQADGEWLGRLPAKVSLGVTQVRMLIPAQRERNSPSGKAEC